MPPQYEVEPGTPDLSHQMAQSASAMDETRRSGDSQGKKFKRYSRPKGSEFPTDSPAYATYDRSG